MVPRWRSPRLKQLCRAAAGLAATGLMSVLIPATAGATYPGHNGLIAFENAPGRADDMDEIDAVLPRGRDPFALLVCPSFGPLTRHFSDPSFAPDGRTFAFSRLGRCAGGQPCCASVIVIARPDGTIVRELPRLTFHDASPQFAPSGRQLVFAGRPARGRQYDLYTVGVDGRGLRRVTTVGAIDPAPCPNGGIAYLHHGDIYLLAPKHRSRRLVARLHGFLPRTAGLSCSPDSRWIAFVRDRDRFSPGNLYVVGVDGRGQRRLTSNDVVIGTPAFSPSGTWIAVDEQHRNTRQWPKPKGCAPGQPRTYYQEVVDLRGHRVYPPVNITCNGQPGGVGWQPVR